MIVCRHFDPISNIRGCLVGRIAFIDCGPGCASYDPERGEIDETIAALWNEQEAEVDDEV